MRRFLYSSLSSAYNESCKTSYRSHFRQPVSDNQDTTRRLYRKHLSVNFQILDTSIDNKIFLIFPKPISRLSSLLISCYEYRYRLSLSNHNTDCQQSHPQQLPLLCIIDFPLLLSHFPLIIKHQVTACLVQSI